MIIPKKRPNPVGEYIREDILKEFKMSQGDLARALKVSRKTVNDLVNDKRSLSADMALRLGKFTKTSPQLWLGLQQDIDLWDAFHSEKAEEIKNILSYAA
ncbi:MAG: HigA family addiction module antidote protein [Desulfobacterales bacterium]|nr:HigA family addiction module antidote protein [Desulfobacterales bacterium]